jgi:hypothetical protein
MFAVKLVTVAAWATAGVVALGAAYGCGDAAYALGWLLGLR